MRTLYLWLLVPILVALAGCGYNTIQRQDEQVKASWSEVLNQYQRRADLVPNLVNSSIHWCGQRPGASWRRAGHTRITQ
jgi:LemA protein